MRKLAFEHAGVGNFEMPSLRMVQTENENSNVVYSISAPKTVYRGESFRYSRAELLKAALNQEELKGNSSGTFSAKPEV